MADDYQPTPAPPAAPGSPGKLTYRPENWWWKNGPLAPGRAAVFDIDGVLADASHRQHMLRGARRNWHAFFEACDRDALIVEVANMAQLLDPAMQIILCTARPSSVAGETLGWLKQHNVRWDLLIMRDYGDYSYARDFKHFTVFELRTYGFDLKMAVEDDPRNKDMFDANGIPCVYIHSGYH